MTEKVGGEPSAPTGGGQADSTTAWQIVPIVECGEPLQRVASENRLFAAPIYRSLGYDGSLDAVYLRAGVTERLRLAARSLPTGLALVVWDGWRPVELQARLYDDYRAMIMRDSSLRGRELEERVGKFVSVPSTDPTRPSPHLTGGAVDVTLSDDRGDPLEMGSEFDELTDRSHMDYYEDGRGEEELAVRDRRRRLLTVMSGAGFTNFPSEWWHFDYGNQFWAHQTGSIAIYGKTAPAEAAREPEATRR